MPTPASDLRQPWHDRFERPTLEQLRKSFNPDSRRLFDQARSILKDELELGERLDWLGLPWRWSCVYADRNAEPGESRGFAYLIPDPAGLHLCVPLTARDIALLPVRKLKKPIRESLVHARNAAGVWWPSWELASPAALDEVFELVRAKADAVRATADVDADAAEAVELAKA